MLRNVEPELLDELPATNLDAIRSRKDLRRVNAVMGQAGILTSLLRSHAGLSRRPPSRWQWVELGAGDGTLLLRVARRLSAEGIVADVTLLDRQDLVSPETHRGFSAIQWSATSVATEVVDWLRSTATHADLILANLFLHHFRNPELTALLRLIAGRTDRFVACEPRRSRVALAASRCLGLLGCNGVTRHDASVSVRAGFNDRELSRLWPAASGWVTREQHSGLFTQSFVARRHE